MEKLKLQLDSYYSSMINAFKNPDFIRVRDKIFAEMDSYKNENPQATAYELKSELHLKIAESFEPVIFDESPFYYEMGLRHSENWGNTIEGLPSCWGLTAKDLNPHDYDKDIISYNSIAVGNVFDTDHHCPAYTKLFKTGLGGILKNIENEKAKADSEKLRFLNSCEKSCLAVLKIAEKFSLKAEEMLENCTDEAKKENLVRIRDTARKIPLNPPENFYEGLCMLWFIREVNASIEGVGTSVLGHLDKLLGDFYERDIANSTLTREKAKILIKKWIMPTYIKFRARTSIWADSSSCIELGGCFEDGSPVFNDVTRLVLEAHEELNYTIPKINCRIAENTPDEFIELISQSILKGRNVYSILNDKAIITALVNNGRSLTDARNYVNGGCQETICEGVEHSAGAQIYFNTPRVMDLTVNGVSEDDIETCTEKALSLFPKKLENPQSFEEAYNFFLQNIKDALKSSVDLRLDYGKNWRNLHPAPFFSSLTDGCIEKGMDYTAGGAKYNQSTICITGLATVIDSIYTIKKAVFEDNLITFKGLCELTKSNWETDTDMHKKIKNLPKYGHGETEVDSLAARFIDDINSYITTLPNERGDKFITSLFTYGFYQGYCKRVNATPDGRRNGEYFSAGSNPSIVNPVKSVLDSISSVNNTDLAKTGGINVLSLNLPFNSNMTPQVVASVIKTFVNGSGHSLQMNYVSKEDLINARKEPEKYKDLIVRVYGFSTYFVNLTDDIKDEFLTRNFYTA